MSIQIIVNKDDLQLIAVNTENLRTSLIEATDAALKITDADQAFGVADALHKSMLAMKGLVATLDRMTDTMRAL